MTPDEYKKAQESALTTLGKQRLTMDQLWCQMGYCDCPLCPNVSKRLPNLLFSDVRSTLLPLMACGELVLHPDRTISRNT